jgi:hypothetical protein
VKYTVEMASGGKTYVPSSIKIGVGFQAILRFGLNNLRGCSVGIEDGKYL